ncbi:MAG TPA: DUF2147 domain-containing protein [Polyangiaceae bacterium]|nr:DUF2147 domain-containing protein [Polyangiaceae bacterium]
MSLPHPGTARRTSRSPLLGLLLGSLMLSTVGSLTLARSARADDTPVGYWTTIDDDGKTATSIIQIYPRGKKLYGKIVRFINPREKDPKCTACDGPRKNQRILGMEILRDFERDDDEWSGGYILDPRNGTEYKCYMELQDGGKKLKVRGYVGIALLGRTQYWQKAAAPPPEPPPKAEPPAKPAAPKPAPPQ